MKILYLSCHSSLEWDEVTLLREIGHYVFSVGSYVEPRNPGDPTMRPAMDFDYDPADVAAWHQLVCSKCKPGEDGKDHLTKEFVERFDLTIIMHIPRWITNNWEAISCKPVLWRTIGQSISGVERLLKPYRDKGLKILRYSPREEKIPGFIGADGMIRFYKDPAEFTGWTGEEKFVINFSQSMKQRGQHCNFDFFEEVTSKFPRKLFGSESESLTYGYGKVPYDRLKEEMRKNRCYFYTGTHPASYTLNFIEAMMSGIPMLCIGPEKGNFFPGHELYEIQDLIKDGQNGFISDNPNYLIDCIDALLQSHSFAQMISVEGRNTAIEHFGKHMIMNAWNAFLPTVV